MADKAELERQVAELTRELQAARAEIERLSPTDALTGVASRRVMDERLAAEAARVHRYGGSVALVFANIHAEAAGDAVLLATARVLRGSARETDLVARYAGGLFAILLPHTAAKDAQVFVDRVRRQLASQPGGATLSFGVAEHTVGKEPSKLIAAAAAALDRAKPGGSEKK
jgi:diguanylate cyclase (GGDEF)-like protein